jgi:hypothetical protein
VTAAELESPGIRRLAVRTDDGGGLAGIAVPGPAPITFVVAHGFTQSVDRPSFRRLATGLSRFGEVRALDYREHGASGGAPSTGGDADTASARALRPRRALTAGALPHAGPGGRPRGHRVGVPFFGRADSGAIAPLAERIGHWASATIDP